jgi:hypothetical protein
MTSVPGLSEASSNDVGGGCAKINDLSPEKDAAPWKSEAGVAPAPQ